MKLTRSIAALLSLLILQSSCQKSTQQPQTNTIPIVNVQPVGPVLKSTTWSNTATEEFTYNVDGTLKKTIGGLAASWGHTRNFTYQNGKLVGVVKDDIKKDEIAYNTAGQIITIKEFVMSSDYHGTRLEFEYNTTGTVKAMKYMAYDEFKSVIKAQTNYDYDAQNQLQKATVTYPGQPQQQLVYTFSDYSTDVQFNPWALLSSWDLLMVDYAYYNYPVLSRLNQLPGKITRKLLVDNAVQETVVKEFNYTIVSKQLQKIQYLKDGLEVAFNY
ncbi:hypothetical protein ABDD95_02915 [Mucilaginibacter sp. PAMB04274]|uniref:hypothetical protein n=1 Tax=Mucilaginibacter sp. PAMB04274 TaxID=3138568 RepID=UPI0031F70EE5